MERFERLEQLEPAPRRETHTLLDEIAEATIEGSRKQHMEPLATVPLLIIDDLGMRKLPSTAAEDLLDIVMRRYERASTLMTSNVLSKIGKSYSVTALQSLPCSIACYITGVS